MVTVKTVLGVGEWAMYNTMHKPFYCCYHDTVDATVQPPSNSKQTQLSSSAHVPEETMLILSTATNKDMHSSKVLYQMGLLRTVSLLQRMQCSDKRC